MEELSREQILFHNTVPMIKLTRGQSLRCWYVIGRVPSEVMGNATEEKLGFSSVEKKKRVLPSNPKNTHTCFFVMGSGWVPMVSTTFSWGQRGPQTMQTDAHRQLGLWCWCVFAYFAHIQPLNCIVRAVPSKLLWPYPGGLGVIRWIRAWMLWKPYKCVESSEGKIGHRA